jgi:hypothetical protein
VKLPDGFGGGALVVGGGGGADAGALVVGAAVACFFAAGFFVVLDGDGLAEGVIGAALTVGVAGAVLATAMPATCVLYENSAARPATVLPSTTTARRMKPPGDVAYGQKSKDSW